MAGYYNIIAPPRENGLNIIVSRFILTMNAGLLIYSNIQS